MANLGRVGIVAQGEYQTILTYKKLDFVTYENSSYIAKEDILLGEIPGISSKWQLACKKGNPGEKGLDAYGHWLSLGNTGTVQDFISSFNTFKVISTLQEDFSTINVAVAQVPNLTLPIKAGKRYKLTGFLYANTAAATTGLRSLLGLVSGRATIYGYIETTASAVTAARANILALDTVVANNTIAVTSTAPPPGQQIPIQIQCIVNCLADGQIGFWFGSEIANSQATLKAGSFIQVEEF